MYQLSTVSLTVDLLADSNRLHPYISHIKVYKTLASWLTLIDIKLALPYKLLLKLYNSFDNIQFTLMYNKNKQPISSISGIYLVYDLALDNTLEKDSPCKVSLYLVNKEYFEFYKEGVDFYSDKMITNVEVLQQIANGKYVRFDPPDKQVSLCRPFIPYMSRIKALAYACRNFSYSDNIYQGYVDYDGFKLINWNVSKSHRKKYNISFMPNQSQSKDWLLNKMYISNRHDYNRRFTGLTYVIESQLNKQPMQIFGDSNINPLASISYPSKSVEKALQESLQVYIECIPFNDPFSIDLLDPIHIITDVAEYQPYTGLYMVTDYVLSCNLTENTFVPYLTLKASRDEVNKS